MRPSSVSIACAGWRTVSVGTPEFVLHMVGIEQWMGCENEEEVIETWRLEGMHEEDIQQTEMIRRADLDAQFPAHVLRPDSKFSRRRIEPLLTHRQRWIKEVARSLLEIVDLVQCKNARLLTTEGIDLDQIYVGALLRWNDRDMSVRVYDNFINYYMQGDGYTELQGVEAVPIDAVSVGKFFKRLEDGLQLLTALDRLIALVTRPQREERSNDNYDDDDSDG